MEKLHANATDVGIDTPNGIEVFSNHEFKLGFFAIMFAVAIATLVITLAFIRVAERLGWYHCSF